VGLVTFNDEVVVIGDGIENEHLVIAGDRLNKFDEILDHSKKAYEKLMKHNISVSF